MGSNGEAARPRAAVLTLGCKVNQFESSSLAESLTRSGYEVCDKALGVDLVVINTCTVTQKADQEALALVRRLVRLNPSAKIVATGCLAQSNPDLLADTGLVNLVLGQDEKARLVEHLGCLADPSAQTVRVAPLAGPAVDFGAPTPERTRAFYKIQDGCTAFCAYCAVPLSRGPSRSLGLDTVLDGLRSYLERGLSEVVLCGIHLGHWGRDLNPPLALADLLHTIGSEIGPDEDFFRLRLSSLEPLELDDEIIEAYDLYPWLAPHFHLPLQSGSDRVLELMGRPYRSAEFREKVLAVHRRRPLAAVGVDVMAGFPGESDGHFQETYDLLESLPVSYFHVFPYSRRPGTRAADSPDQVPEHLKRARTLKLKELNRDKRRIFAEANYGSQQLALVENTAHQPSGRMKVLTGNYLSALLPAAIQGLPPGSLLPVTISPSRNQWDILEAEPQG
ncbi:tRNA (N(6)-L-threonylcarbamoyladenosine(37)-C(2))-methylthiotransferase MtaB [Deltaproteobacteria bacterium OttesenSCG-928-M10]|nr:tRNA (N(6)-L-threonylcarbamoyladenosine(37)-C(2))-methylthiotransferase MtaB [Deltaproteobacteria bacterium OttesenSCG-928-M10]